MKTSENFLASEHQCKGERYGSCKCGGTVKIDERQAELEQKIRDRVGKPLCKTSGYRCPDNNNATPGSSTTSQHMDGAGTDFSTWGTGLTVNQLAEIAKECGAVRIGKYPNKNFVHVSFRDKMKSDGSVASREWTIY